MKKLVWELMVSFCGGVTGKQRHHNGKDIAYRHLTGHWYLFYEHQIW